MARDDRVLPYTRALALVLLPFLAVAVVLLYLLPTRTHELFAWTIRPPLTAMVLASAYIGGIWFFTVVLIGRGWHRVAHGFPAVVLFAALLGLATALHGDRFHAWHPSFVAWAVLYATTPVLALAAVLANRRTAPAAPTVIGRAAAIPPAQRVALAAVGLAAAVCGVVLFVAPAAAIPGWPWQLTPLTARVVGAVLTLPGAVNVWMLVDARWSAFRSIMQAEIASLVAIAVALALAGGDLDWRHPNAPVLVVGVVGSLAVWVGVYATCERRSRSAVREHLHPDGN